MNLLNENIIVTNIQRFCLHDGSGIRTTVFIKGCNLHCPWCANPENISFIPEAYKTANNSTGYYGQIKSLDTIYNEVIRDKKFYKEDGGVTFSGGEPLLQIKKLIPLLEEFHKEKISICFETALCVSEDLVRLAVNFINEIIIDIKILNKENFHTITGGDIDTYCHNIDILSKTSIPITFRIPLISPFVTDEKNIFEIISFLKQLCYSKIELIKGHNLGDNKYKSLINKPSGGGYKVPDLSKKQLQRIEQLFKSNDLNISICKI